MGREQALALTRQDPGQVLAAAGALRDRLKGRTLTYSPKVFVPVTNLCRDRCSYCTFRKSPRDPAAHTMSLDEIRAVSARGARAGCHEALMCLGDRPETAYPSYGEQLRLMGAVSTPAYVAMACQVSLEEGLLPHTNAGLLTEAELEMLRPLNVSMGLMLENISPRLRQKGMPHSAAPDKDPSLRMQMLEAAGRLKIPFTTGILIGIGETWEERVDSLLAIRDCHDRYGHIQEVIVQTFRAKPGTRMQDFGHLSDLELAHTVAIARLLLGPMNLQAPPNLTPDGHHLLIAAGINDWGGISPVTQDFINPEAPWPHLQALRATCREAGYELEPRLPVYPEYLNQDFVEPRLLARMEAL
ncbi:MAG: 7,8-didemethyl-8-hydroxy-5-deazariboflavin synthase CofG [Candidatus Eremiobacteraeota bacterium]|nr:7,8-didemethyl-8-hydroxy-5-deazariboflavin synthase CofG [Candidatus Eremiobacteraeota bacterium]